MSVNKELWAPIIEETLFASYELLSQLATDDAIYVNSSSTGKYHKVYIPQSGDIDGVTVNPSVYPLSVSERTDTTLDYSLDHLAMNPIRLGGYDISLLSYDKMKSIIHDFTGNIGEAQLYKTFVNWYIGKNSGQYVETTGTATRTSSAPSSTATVKKMLIADLISARNILKKQKIYGTYKLILPVDMFDDLYTDILEGSHNVRIVEKDGLTMLDSQFMGCDVYQFPSVANVTSAGAIRAYGHVGATGDLEAGYLLHPQYASFAKGDLNVYVDDSSATYLGDVVSAEAWIGGSYRRTDKKGIVPIIQAT